MGTPVGWCARHGCVETCARDAACTARRGLRFLTGNRTAESRLRCSRSVGLTAIERQVGELSTAGFEEALLDSFADFGNPFPKSAQRAGEPSSMRALARQLPQKAPTKIFTNPFAKAFREAFPPTDPASMKAIDDHEHACVRRKMRFAANTR